MKKKTIVKCVMLLSIISLSWNNIYAQCMYQIFHTSGTTTINGIQVIVVPFGHSDTITTYCSGNTQPYLIGANYTTPNSDGSYRFQFSPPIDSLTLNFGGIHDDGVNKEIVKINVNGNHYSIPSVGNSNGCDSLAVLTPAGNITGAISGSASGWSGTIITGPISEITIIDSIVTGSPNGTVFSLFICSENATSISERNKLELLIYPIPTNDKITIEGLSNREIKIDLFDLLGRKKHIYPLIQDNKAVIDVADLPKGIYFVVITANRKTVTQKVIIE